MTRAQIPWACHARRVCAAAGVVVAAVASLACLPVPHMQREAPEIDGVITAARTSPPR